jgi:hypothetical protein
MVPDLAGLLRALVDGDVEFVTIGGIAMAAHRVVRATEDVDIVPEPSAANLTRLADTLVALDARLLRVCFPGGSYFDAQRRLAPVGE